MINEERSSECSRRRFLQLMGGAFISSTGLSSSCLWAAPANDANIRQRLLVVFLRGAYDAANLLIPYRSADYYRLRPNIAIAAPESGNSKSALALDENWALHPALRDTLYPMWQNKELAFIPFAGSDDTSRSHFETQDRIEAGLDEHAFLSNQKDGFLARPYLMLNQPSSIAFTAQLPVIFTGKMPIPNLALRDAGKAPFDERLNTLLADLYKGQALANRVTSGLALRQEIANMLAEEMKGANRGAVSAAGFELEAGRMGKLMRDQYQLGFVDVGGWDTHVNQGAAQGAFANLLGNLGRGLASFKEELGLAWRDTAVLVVSEFGRTFRENGNYGTDHGHGTVFWALGGRINGGRILGDQVVVSEQTLFQKRDYVVLNEYRSVIAGLLQELYGLNEQQLANVFPNARPKPLSLLRRN